MGECRETTRPLHRRTVRLKCHTFTCSTFFYHVLYKHRCVWCCWRFVWLHETVSCREKLLFFAKIQTFVIHSTSINFSFSVCIFDGNTLVCFQLMSISNTGISEAPVASCDSKHIWPHVKGGHFESETVQGINRPFVDIWSSRFLLIDETSVLQMCLGFIPRPRAFIRVAPRLARRSIP